MADAELTKYFQAAVADSVSSIEAPKDAMEQQAEDCQAEKMQAGETNMIKGEGGRIVERGEKGCQRQVEKR